MSEDEQAIRKLIETWMLASQAGDVPRLMTLMADDVVFMVPHRPPFGKQVFASQAEQMKLANLEAASEILELEVIDDRAWCRSHLNVTVTSPNGMSRRRSGYVLTIFKKKPNGEWVLYRDANLLGE